jgi:hypothetical protein
MTFIVYAYKSIILFAPLCPLPPFASRYAGQALKEGKVSNMI